MRHTWMLLALAIASAEPAKKIEPAEVPPPVLVRTPKLARVVQYGIRDTIELYTRPLYTTMIVLPEKENIISFVIGDKEFWQLSGQKGNVAWLKPSENALRTTVNLVTVSGNV